MDAGESVDAIGSGGIALGVLDCPDLRSERIPVQLGDVLMVGAAWSRAHHNDAKRKPVAFRAGDPWRD